MPGPVPKRRSELSRESTANAKAPITNGVLLPPSEDWSRREVPENWPPQVRDLWLSAFSSGQQAFMQDTDFALLWFACVEAAEYVMADKRSAMMLTALMGIFERLMFTEGDRRRVRIELQHPIPQAVPDREIGKAANIRSLPQRSPNGNPGRS